MSQVGSPRAVVRNRNGAAIRCGGQVDSRSKGARTRMLAMDEEALLQEQIEYYDKCAGQYDEMATPPDESFVGFGHALDAALDRFAPTGRVLEIASGTGAWTVRLLDYASSVLAVDASPEMIKLARSRVGGDRRVRFVKADAFSWQPDDEFDVVFFASWISHVPPARFDAFWGTVDASLRRGGRVFFVDELRDAWRYEHLREEFLQGHPVPIVRRSLRGGQSFRVVKVYWAEEELESRLRALGWRIGVHAVGPFFWAQGQRV